MNPRAVPIHRKIRDGDAKIGYEYDVLPRAKVLFCTSVLVKIAVNCDGGTLAKKQRRE